MARLSFGHMLGIDVHDCANARAEKYRSGELGEGYVLTVEPGLYFQPDDDLVPPELGGIGIRMGRRDGHLPALLGRQHDLAVTPHGYIAHERFAYADPEPGRRTRRSCAAVDGRN